MNKIKKHRNWQDITPSKSAQSTYGIAATFGTASPTLIDKLFSVQSFCFEGCKPDDYHTFQSDFFIAEKFGFDAIKRTYARAFADWKDDVKMFASLVMTLNHMIWYWYEKDEPKARVYDQLWKEADAYGCEHFTGLDRDYYFGFLD